MQIANVAKSERREHVLSALTNNRNRFKCGREIKKRTTIWGLRVRLPPPAPCVSLPISGMIKDDELRELWQGNRRLQFLPLGDKPVTLDVHTKNLMMGVAYQQNSTQSDSDSPSPSPEILHDTPALEPNRTTVLSKNEYLGAGNFSCLFTYFYTSEQIKSISR